MPVTVVGFGDSDEEVEVVVTGPVASGAGPAWVHHQTTPAATWTINHDQPERPEVLLFEDSDPDNPVFTDVTYPAPGTVVVEWPSATTGWAYVG